jgi:hypothetical protein
MRWRKFINPALAAAAFIGTCSLFYHLLPPPEVEGVTPKLQFFRSHQDEFDTLFIGSSRIYHQISPAIFDDVMRTRGVSTRSFNFGIDGMHLPESFYVLELVLASKPRQLKWVFIEFDNLQVLPWPGYRGTQRLLYWHDWTRTSFLVHKLFHYNIFKPQHGEKQREYLGIHLALFAKKFCNVGAVSVLIRERFLPELDPPTAAKVLGPRHDGFFAGDVQMSSAQKIAYERALAQARELQIAKPRVVDPYADKAFRLCAQEILKQGAVPIFVVPPAVGAGPVAFRTSASPPGVVLAFNDYDAFSALFRADVRANEGHLNKTGAEEFTRVLAKRFADELATNAIH